MPHTCLKLLNTSCTLNKLTICPLNKLTICPLTTPRDLAIKTQEHSVLNACEGNDRGRTAGRVQHVHVLEVLHAVRRLGLPPLVHPVLHIWPLEDGHGLVTWAHLAAMPIGSAQGCLFTLSVSMKNAYFVWARVFIYRAKDYASIVRSYHFEISKCNSTKPALQSRGRSSGVFLSSTDGLHSPLACMGSLTGSRLADWPGLFKCRI